MNKLHYITIGLSIVMVTACKLPERPQKTGLTVKNNFIILLDLSDRLIVQEGQPARDKEIIHSIFSMFEDKVKKDLYIRSRDEIRVVIAPQKGAGLPSYMYEDKMYINMSSIPNFDKRKKEAERREIFNAYLDTLYSEAVFSRNPKEYYGADIWKYVYEDLNKDIVHDTLTKNYLIILTDGYPIVGTDPTKLQPVKRTFPDLDVILVEMAPREKDMEWDRIMELWTGWLKDMNVKSYTFIKRKAITKEIEEIKGIVSGS